MHLTLVSDGRAHPAMLPWSLPCILEQDIPAMQSISTSTSIKQVVQEGEEGGGEGKGRRMRIDDI
jgi:hypothetical protein